MELSLFSLLRGAQYSSSVGRARDSGFRSQGEEVPGSIPAAAARFPLVGSVSV